MKRIALFVLTNLAIMVVLVLFLTVLVVRVRHQLQSGRADAECRQPGDLFARGRLHRRVHFAVAVASRWRSGQPARRSSASRRNAMESWLVGAVRSHAEKAGIGMPEVAIFEGEPNAFATGAFKNSALGRGVDRPAAVDEQG